jgi:putative transcriptional regulator
MEPETRASLLSLSDAQAEAAALGDPDNPPVSSERLDRMLVAREVRRVRQNAGLSQANFAAVYKIKLGRLRDWEQGRTEPDLPMLVFLQFIARNPQRAAKTVETIQERFHAA